METDWDIVAMRRWSKAMFEKRHRLAVALEVLAVSKSDPAQLYAQQIARNLSLDDTEVREHLADFCQVGLLERAPVGVQARAKRSGPGRPPALFRRTDDHFWTCLQELGERFRRSPPSSSERGTGG